MFVENRSYEETRWMKFVTPYCYTLWGQKHDASSAFSLSVKFILKMSEYSVTGDTGTQT